MRYVVEVDQTSRGQWRASGNDGLRNPFPTMTEALEARARFGSRGMPYRVREEEGEATPPPVTPGEGKVWKECHCNRCVGGGLR